MLSAKEIEALIFLLDDPDPDIFEQVSSRLLEAGPDVLPLLEQAWERDASPIFQERVEHLTHYIQFESVRKDLQTWAAEDGEDLLEAVLLLDRYAFPERDQQGIREKVAELRRAVWLELSQHLSPLERVHVINQVLFRHRGFAGLDDLARDPRAAFLSTVLETKKGNPLGLGLLYLVLAQQLELPVYGVRFPQHPLLAITDRYLSEFHQGTGNAVSNGLSGEVAPGEGTEESGELWKDRVLFYCYPFRQGAVVTAKDIRDNLRKAGLEIKPEVYQPVTNRVMMQEALLILEGMYKESEDAERAEEVRELRQALGEPAGDSRLVSE